MLEAKYLKGNDQRLYIDLVKLAIPLEEKCPRGEWDRLLLVAGDSDILYKSSVLKELKKRKSEGDFDLASKFTSGELKEFKTRVDKRNLWPKAIRFDCVFAKPFDEEGSQANQSTPIKTHANKSAPITHNAVVFTVARVG